MHRLGGAIVAALAVVAALAACGDDEASAPSTASTQAGQTAPASTGDDPIAVIDALLRERAPDDGRLWQRALTPRLPLSWPPAADTPWVVYAYATAFDPQLADGVRVSEPYARIVEAADGSAQVEPLGAVEAVEIQGVSPVTQEQLAALQGLGTAAEATRGLTGEPGADDPAAAAIRGPYGAWLAANGAIASRLPGEHAAFLAWVAAG